MKIILSPTGAPSLSSSIVSLGEIFPIINGQRCNPQPDRRWQVEGKQFFQYAINQPECTAFLLEIEQKNAVECVIRYSVFGGTDEGALNSFGIGFQSIENVRQYLRHGYHSWDGSYFVDPKALAGWGAEEFRPETGYAMTQLLPRSGSGSLVLGFDRHDRFQQSFSFDTHKTPLSLVIETIWDQKDRRGLECCQSEQLIIFEHPGVEEALRQWARQVAAASPLPPRQMPPIIGWCSWYNLYNAITEEIILQHLQGVRDVSLHQSLPIKIFQIDDGFTPEMGDWLEVKPTFPRGIKPLLDDIRRAGFIPGLWIAPFLVGNRSHLFQDHPDWVVRERQTGEPLAHLKFYGEFRWGKRSEEYYILDTTHPAAFDYLRYVFHVWHHTWGCNYFKTDFMYFGAAYGPERAQWHTPGMSRIEIWHRTAEMIRAEISNAFWTGCGCPLWAAVGLVDGMRIGRDVGVEWCGNQSAQSLLRDQSTRNFTHQIFWQIDPDCILLRERFHNLTDVEVQTLALFAGMSGGLLMTSDALEELSPRRLALWKLLLNPQRSVCDYPLLGYSEVISKSLNGNMPHELQTMDPVIVQVRHAQTSAVFIFNSGDSTVKRNYTLTSLGLPEKQYVYDWNNGTALAELTDTLRVVLPLHSGALFFVQSLPFVSAPEQIN